MRLVRLPASALTLLCAVLTLGPLLLLTYLAIARSTDAVEEEAQARLASTASASAVFVDAELRGLSEVVASYASRTLLAHDLRAGPSPARDRDLRRHLRQLRANRPGIAIAFVADTTGRLLEIVPETPAIVGDDFSSRDWYRGVLATGEPYVSEAYVTAATGHRRVVAAASLVPGKRGEQAVGILVAGYSLSHLQGFTERFAREQGIVLTVTDQRGVVVAAPEAVPRALVSRADDEHVRAALNGRTGIVDHSGEGGTDLAAYAPVAGLGWTVTASVPRTIAFARVERARESVLLTAAGLGVALMAGIAVLGLTLRRRQEAEERERQALLFAEGRNTQLARARDELELRNAELEGHAAALAQTQALLEEVVKEVEDEKAHAQTLAAINGAVLDATVDGIGMVDLEGELVLKNAALRRMIDELGLTEEQIPYGALPVASDPDRLSEFVEGLVAEPEEEDSTEFELRERVLHVHSGPVRSGDGTPMGRIFLTRDVTRERRAERAKSELVATVAHELRTPLTGILGFAELLEDDDTDPETRRAYVQTIGGEALRLKALIDDFLDLHRIEEGNFTLSLAPVSLDELVAEQAHFYDAQSAQHSVEVDIEPELTVLGEHNRLAQVLANLLTNAIKYSPEGGPVRVTARRSGPCVLIEVCDSGIGIPADQQRRVFEKFFRVDSTDTRRIGGTGLGLTLCRDIVEAHGGRIEFESVEGIGSTFRIELPSVEEFSQRASPRQRVLVVEDDPGTAELLRVYLEEDGYDVDVAASGEEALARADQRPPALICLDIGLASRLDGWAVLARLKESPRTANIPVVICTGADVHGRAVELGAAGFLGKPVDRDRLIGNVSELVGDERGSVLVVDDDEHVRSFLTEALTREGLEVRVASNGAEGLDLARRRPPDLLLLDLLMPGMDGIEVLEHLGADERLRDIPVVVLTADDLNKAERDQLSERTESFLEKKAYSAHELRRLVEQVLAA